MYIVYYQYQLYNETRGPSSRIGKEKVMEIAHFFLSFSFGRLTHTPVFTVKYSQLTTKIPNVKDCKCEILHCRIVRIHLVCNSVFKQKKKIGGRHRYVMDILKRAGLAKDLSPFAIQIVAWTRDEARRRRKINAELQPDYVRPEKKPKSKDTTTTSSNKRKKARTVKKAPTAAKPLGDHNVQDDEADDDGDESDGGWDSEASEDEEEELEDTTESDIEFEAMMLDSDDESFGDINIDSDDEDGNDKLAHEDDTGDVVLGCICGRPHDLPSPKLFWIRCDNCDAWYHVSADCINFDEITAEKLDSWRCPSCATQDSHE